MLFTSTEMCTILLTRDHSPKYWDIKRCSFVIKFHAEGDNRFLRNIGTHLPYYTSSLPKLPTEFYIWPSLVGPLGIIIVIITTTTICAMSVIGLLAVNSAHK
jgi:hypothetical protein